MQCPLPTGLFDRAEIYLARRGGTFEVTDSLTHIQPALSLSQGFFHRLTLASPPPAERPILRQLAKAANTLLVVRMQGPGGFPGASVASGFSCPHQALMLVGTCMSVCALCTHWHSELPELDQGADGMGGCPSVVATSPSPNTAQTIESKSHTPVPRAHTDHALAAE